MALASRQALLEYVADVFQAAGATRDGAALVARELVTANEMGLASHGVIRVKQYVADIENRRILPGAGMTIVRETAACALVDCGRDFGQVSAYGLLAIAIAKAAEQGLSVVVGRSCNHVGRLGAYAESAARCGYVCLATVSIPPRGHFVVPWGGRDGRLGTNPIAYGIPTDGDPIVSDFSTSVMSEGKIRLARNRGVPLPKEAVLDASGQPTTDPQRFYGPPMGRLLPFGGSVGYKGYALGLLAEFLGATLGGLEVEDDGRTDNGVFLLLIDPARFLPGGEFPERTSELADYVRSSEPVDPDVPVTLPGERGMRARARAGQVVDIDDATWGELTELGARLGVAAPQTT